MQYALDDRQRDLVRTISAGLRDGSIKRTWTWMNMPSDTVGGELDQVFTSGIPEDRGWEIRREDFRDFEACGLLELTANDGRSGSYHLFEQAIHDAVDNDFRVPDSVPAPTQVQANFYGPISGSNVAVAQIMDHYSQSVSSLPNVSNDDKAKLEALISEVKEKLIPFQESHPNEVRDVTRSIDLVMGDLAEEATDKDNIRGAIARLKRAGSKLMFSTAALATVEKLAEFIESLPHGAA